MQKLRELSLQLIKWLNDHRIPVRLIVAVFVGVVVSKLLTTAMHEILHLAGVLPPLREPLFDRNLLLICLAYHSVFGVLSAYITAAIAEKKARRAVFILGTKEAVLWLLGILLLWKHSAPWYNLTKALLGIPLAILGGRLYIWHCRKKEKEHALPDQTNKAI
ncbi:MAG: hypothetical protein ACXVPQ_10150 [Bacteroidia bacterium]